MNKPEEPKSPSGESKERTPAYANFDSNTDKLLHVFGFISRETGRFASEYHGAVAEIGNLKDNPDIVNRVKKMSDLLETINEFALGFVTLYQWVPVILVTIVEAYLKDVLTYAATIDPTHMNSSQQSASYADLIGAQSLEDLAQELRSRWARNFVNDGGPKAWITKLTKMGARGYRPELGNEMETLWGVRHLIVHSVGVATPDFVRRHPEIRIEAGKELLIRTDQIKAWADAIYHFVDITDFYFVQRYRSKPDSTS